MNERDSLNQAISSVAAARQQAALLQETIERAISCTPSGGTRNGLTEANIEVGLVKTRLCVSLENLTDNLRALGN